MLKSSLLCVPKTSSGRDPQSLSLAHTPLSPPPSSPSRCHVQRCLCSLQVRPGRILRESRYPAATIQYLVSRAPRQPREKGNGDAGDSEEQSVEGRLIEQGTNEAQPLAKDWHTVNGCLGGREISSVVWPLVRSPQPWGQPHPRSVSSPHETRWVTKKEKDMKIDVGAGWRRGGSAGVGGMRRGEYDQSTLCA